MHLGIFPFGKCPDGGIVCLIEIQNLRMELIVLLLSLLELCLNLLSWRIVEDCGIGIVKQSDRVIRTQNSIIDFDHLINGFCLGTLPEDVWATKRVPIVISEINRSLCNVLMESSLLGFLRS